ncbi:ABC transporter substrate-binding protein [Pseudonocardia sp. ICBG1142]|uniref:ABC transporter substrate-binding protein n=1 Tax=Pseudonocardia sp. ICBG1142 TaxID=2846760 RepID=UPI001CF6B9FF|nr:ABC transporter substrate-binding protein [Pseudonocardia sp. ICBG1142]
MSPPDLPPAGVGIGRRTVLRTLLLGGLGVAAPGALAGCARRMDAVAGAGPVTAVRGGTVVWGKPLEALALNPTTSSVGASWELIQVVYEPLVELDDDLGVVPALAQSWENPAPGEWVFTLRSGARFSNGRPVDADDVVGTFARHLDPAKPTAFASYIGGTGTTVSRVDDRRVRFVLGAPREMFLSALSAAVAVILPIREIGAGEVTPATEMLGTGPFMVESHRQDRDWVLVRNPFSWRPPTADRLEVPIILDTNARIAALRNGSIDIATFDEPDAALLLSDVPAVAVQVQPRTDFFVLTLNAVGDTPFTDRRVRQAVAHGIDRERIRQVALAGVGAVTGPVSATFPGALPTTVHRDTAKARTLLAEAARTDLHFEIIYGGPVAGGIAQIIQQDLAEIGVTVRATQLEAAVLNQRSWVSTPARMDAAVSFYAAFGGPLMAMRNWSPELAPFTAGFQEDDPSVTDLVTRAWSASGPSADAAVRRASTALEEQANTIPLVTKPGIVAYRADRVAPRISRLDGNLDVMQYAGALSRVRTGGA